MIPISDAAGVRRRFPWVVVAVIVLNVLAFVYELSLSERGLNSLFTAAGVVPVEFTRGQQVGAPPPLDVTWTTLLTSMFLHGGFLHIGSNMLFLWVFGDNVEDRFGHLPFLVFYLVTGLVASATHILLNAGSNVPSIGASGAIAGVLAGYIMMFPHATVRTLLFIGPFITITRVSAMLLIGFWFVTQLFAGLASLGVASEQTSGIAVWAHVGGFLAGFVLTPFFRRRGSF